MRTAYSRFLILSLVCALFAGLLFTPGLPGEFLFDDIPSITDNSSIHLQQFGIAELTKLANTPQISGDARLLPTISFAFDYWRAGGAEPAVFKTTNILIHVLTTFALAWLFRSVLLAAGVPATRASWQAPSLALAWAIHPLQVSSVLYVVQRIQTMSTLFLVLALCAYLTGRKSQINGHSGSIGLLLTLLFWLLAMGCKEDSALLPAYTLALELTVLRFAAANVGTVHALRRSYLLAALAGAALYMFVVIPHYWNWNTYPGRDFSSIERLLTQARVLCMYLWQIVLPMPSHMPFYYDWLQPSRGWLQPWTTLPAAATILTLLGSAWRLRARWPLFALGVFWFLGAHFITSNVIPLELAFEHRNNFALAGAVLAIASLLAHINARLQLPRTAQATAFTVLFVVLASTTVIRASSWKSNIPLARANATHAPDSARAWALLCASHLNAGGGVRRGNPHLDEAINACRNGAVSAPYALSNPTLLIILKTLRGDVTQHDWEEYQWRLANARATQDNRKALTMLMYHAREGVSLDKRELFKAIATLANKAPLEPYSNAAVGYFLLNDMSDPDAALPYFLKALKASSLKDPFPRQLANELRLKGRPDLAERIEQLDQARRHAMGYPGQRGKSPPP